MHSKLNFSSKDSWSLYESHRNSMTELLVELIKEVEVREPKTNVLIVGAGNLNDLNLKKLLSCTSGSYEFWDLDLASVEMGLRRQKVEVDPRVRATQCDVSDPGAVLDCLSGEREFDLIVSTCLISQLLLSQKTKQDKSRTIVEHLNFLANSTKVSVLVTENMELISPADKPVPAPFLEATVLSQCMTPIGMLGELDIELAFFRSKLFSEKYTLQGIDPWFWQLNDNCTFLVSAAVFRRFNIGG